MLGKNEIDGDIMNLPSSDNSSKSFPNNQKNIEKENKKIKNEFLDLQKYLSSVDNNIFGSVDDIQLQDTHHLCIWPRLLNGAS